MHEYPLFEYYVLVLLQQLVSGSMASASEKTLLNIERVEAFHRFLLKRDLQCIGSKEQPNSIRPKGDEPKNLDKDERRQSICCCNN